MKRRSGRPSDSPGREPVPSLFHNTELDYLNRNFALSRHYQSESRGLLAPIKKRAKAMLASFTFQFLEDYLASEAEFLAHLVRLENEIARRIDRLNDDCDRIEAETREALRQAERAVAFLRDAEEKAGDVETEA